VQASAEESLPRLATEITKLSAEKAKEDADYETVMGA
jgi:hypothetical protein